MNTKMQKAYGIYFLIAICFVALRALSAFGLLDFLGGYTEIVFSILIQIVLLFCGSIFLFSIFNKSKLKDTFKFFGYNKITKKSVGIAFLLGFIVFVLNIFVSSAFSSLIGIAGYVPNVVISTNSSYPVWLMLLNLVFTAILPGICEETVHRGMILSSSRGIGKAKAIMLSSLLFGLIHLNIEQFFYACIIGLYLGYITVLTDSIFPAMIIHFMNNALSVLLSFSEANGLFFAKIFNNFISLVGSNLIIGGLLVILVLVVFSYLLIKLTSYLVFDSVKLKIKNKKKEFDKLMQKELYFLELENLKNPISKKTKSVNLDEVFFNDFLEKECVKTKSDAISRAFMALTILLLVVVTAFTFVWGVI